MEMRGAFRVRLEQSTQFQRAKGFAALVVQASGEKGLAARMHKTFQAVKSYADASPVLPPEATPAAGPSPAAPISQSQVPVLASARTGATTPEDAPL
eukprot:911073-Pyramimonas_sp.AAC.1